MPKERPVSTPQPIVRARTDAVAKPEAIQADDPAPRILIVTEALLPNGDERLWAEAQALRSVGFTVCALCPTPANASAHPQDVDGIHIYHYARPFKARRPGTRLIGTVVTFFNLSMQASSIRRLHGIDVVHVHNSPDLLFRLARSYKRKKKKIVFDYDDAAPERYEIELGHQDSYYRLLKQRELSMFKIADMAIVTSDTYRQIAIDQNMIAPERIVVVRYGPDIVRIRRAAIDPRWRNKRAYMVAYSGLVAKSEGLDLLIEAIANIVQKRLRRNIQFVIAGGGPELRAIAMSAGEKSLGDYITFTGRIDEAVARGILATAHVCVDPRPANVFNDISTSPRIIEYMSLKKPIVQFDTREGRSLTENASNYAKPNDPVDFAEKIIELIDYPERSALMGEHGGWRAAELIDWRRQRPRFLAAYKGLFESTS